MRNWVRCPPCRCSSPAISFFPVVTLPPLLYPGQQGWSDENPAPGGDTNACERHDIAPHEFAVACVTTAPGHSAAQQWEQPRDRVIPPPVPVVEMVVLCPVCSLLRRLPVDPGDPPGCLNTGAVKLSRHRYRAIVPVLLVSVLTP